MVERCPGCGLSYEHEEGYWVGAMTVSIGVVLLTTIAALGVTVIATWPDIPVVPVIVIGVIATGLFPIIFYPFSKTIWVALDLAFFNRGATSEGRRDSA